MITLYYSGAKVFNAIQNNPDLSLGGWLSSTIIPNDLMNNLFGTISEKGQSEALSETKAIFLVNDTEVKTNFSIYIEQANSDEVIFEFSVVAVPNGQSMERISSIRSLPYYADFFTANGIDNAELMLESFTANQVIGLWIRRTAIQRPTAPDVIDYNNTQDPFNLWYANLQNKQENPAIMFSWN